MEMIIYRAILKEFYTICVTCTYISTWRHKQCYSSYIGFNCQTIYSLIWVNSYVTFNDQGYNPQFSLQHNKSQKTIHMNACLCGCVCVRVGLRLLDG